MKKLALGFLISMFSANALASAACHSLFELSRPSEEEINLRVFDLYQLRSKIWSENTMNASVARTQFNIKLKELSQYLPIAEINAKFGMIKLGESEFLKINSEINTRENSNRVMDEIKALNAQDINGNTLLMLAVQNNKEGDVQALLNKGVDTEISDRRGVTPLRQAILAGREAIVVMLIEAKANVNEKSLQVTLLGQAAEYRQINIVAKLLEANADVNGTAGLGTPPLTMAVRGGSSNIVKMLIKAGANVNYEDRNGYTALKEAKLFSQTEIEKILRDAGARE